MGGRPHALKRTWQGARIEMSWGLVIHAQGVAGASHLGRDDSYHRGSGASEDGHWLVGGTPDSNTRCLAAGFNIESRAKQLEVGDERRRFDMRVSGLRPSGEPAISEFWFCCAQEQARRTAGTKADVVGQFFTTGKNAEKGESSPISTERQVRGGVAGTPYGINTAPRPGHRITRGQYQLVEDEGSAFKKGTLKQLKGGVDLQTTVGEVKAVREADSDVDSDIDSDVDSWTDFSRESRIETRIDRIEFLLERRNSQNRFAESL
ncbi:hypothetical protein C8J57DRAFT_1255538 [Mycena rebaudengoi]|nr:hypothetical protein C8J57DRAFT_1255538 [Mycena rebaudengoi]